ncbi:MAG: RNA polymerase factor sigma-54 [Planctomycetota bacterium]|nr:RNA polymerase factor sigma-54 [Planctomycetota bacterium]
MRMQPGVYFQQKQQQILSPRMIQSMEILQLPLAALEERIDEELVENPVLEVNEKDPATPDEQADRENSDDPTLEERELVVDTSGENNSDDFERMNEIGTEVLVDSFEDYSRPSSNRVQEISDRHHDQIANIVDNSHSFHEHLLLQIAEMDLDEDTELACERIISSLDADDGGYLRTTLVDLLPAKATEEDLEIANKALKIIQHLDPVGIAARDLRECLLLQIPDEHPFAEEMRKLVGNHLEDLRDNRLPLIVKQTEMSIDDIQLILEDIKELNPKPAASFASRTAPTVTPELEAIKDPSGVYKIKIDEGPGRRLFISRYYRERLADGSATAEEKEFIKRKLNAAQWLIESIEQRRSTLTRVAQAIVDHQKDFLEQGPEFIHPLKMQQIAEKVGVHVTTVSRAVDDKWIETPRGIFPLKKFFVGGTTNTSGEDVAWDKIRIRLQELIDEEDKAKPYSDDEIVKRLNAKGLKVARRTVTKYRKKMGIPSSRQRRQWS